MTKHFWVYRRICGSKWRISAAGRQVRYAWGPAATRAGGSKPVAAARLPAAEMLVRLGDLCAGLLRISLSGCCYQLQTWRNLIITNLSVCLIFTFLSWARPLACVAQQAFQADGILDQYNNSVLTRSYHFTAIIKNNQWLIRTIPDKKSPVAFYEDSYDGKYVYSYLQLSDAPTKHVVNSSSGDVEANDIPNNKSDYVVATWLAYGSGYYFNKIKGNKVKPFFDWAEPNPSELNTQIKVDIKRFDRAPFLPSYIYSKDLNRRYSVLQFTNFQTFLLPKEFVIDCFNPYSEKTTNSPFFSYHGHLSGVALIHAELSDQDFKPHLDGRTYTEDRRFPNRESERAELTYLNKSNQWLETNNPQLVALYRQQRFLQPPDSELRQPNRLKVLIFLAFPTIAFFFFAFVQRKKN